MSDADLRQNVTDATHNRGNVLDLAITASSSSLVKEYLLTILTPITLLFPVTLPPQRPARPEKTITYVDMLRLTTPALEQMSVSVISSPNLSVMCAAYRTSTVPSCRIPWITKYHYNNVR